MICKLAVHLSVIARSEATKHSLKGFYQAKKLPYGEFFIFFHLSSLLINIFCNLSKTTTPR